MPRAAPLTWDGSISVDGTHINTVKRGNTARSSRVSSEPNAGWYVRGHDIVDDPAGRDDVQWAWDAALASMTHPDIGGQFPRLILGMSMDKPGLAPIPNAMIALRNTFEADLPRGYMIGDMAYYPHAKAEQWQIPVRVAGYKIVGDLRSDATGIQGGYGGALLVDGSWHCPATPKTLTDASPDHQADKITDAEWMQRLDRRDRYRLRPKEAPRDNGSQCFKCPASGPGATVDCPLKPPAPRTTKGTRTKIRNADLPRKPGPVCTNTNSVTIPVEAGAKFAQALPWQSADWHRVYHQRNNAEAKNAWIKDSRGGSVKDHSRRLLRGVAGQFLLVSIMVAAENIRAIEAFRQHERDNDQPAPQPTSPNSPSPSTRTGRHHHSLTDPANAPPVAA